MGLFQTTWRTQVEKLLPPELRSGSVIDFLTSLVHPLQVTMDANEAFDFDIRLRAKFNGRKMILQAALNTIFAQPANTIIVETQFANIAYNNYIYNESEGITIFTYGEAESSNTMYTFNESEPISTFDFLVKVPIGIYTAELDRRIRAEVKLYKLAGKTFDVVTY